MNFLADEVAPPTAGEIELDNRVPTYVINLAQDAKGGVGKFILDYCVDREEAKLIEEQIKQGEIPEGISRLAVKPFGKDLLDIGFIRDTHDSYGVRNLLVYIVKNLMPPDAQLSMLKSGEVLDTSINSFKVMSLVLDF